MADGGTFIPGFSDKFNSNEAINKIMEAHKAKLEKKEEVKENLIEEKDTWEELKTKVATLKGYAKDLYGFNAPFEEKISLSSDEYAFNAQVSKAADIGEHTLNILQKATSHKIASMSLDRNYTVPKGRYEFNVGDDTVSFMFNGGTLDTFTDQIRKYGKNILKASVTWDTSTTQVFMLESAKTGEKNLISFANDQTKQVFKDMGFYKDTISYDKQFTMNTTQIEATSGSRERPIVTADGNFQVQPRTSFLYTLPEQIPQRDNLTMEIDLSLHTLSDDEAENQGPPTGPNFSSQGDVNIFDIDIEGEKAFVDIPAYQEKTKEKPQKVEDDHYLEIKTNRRTITIPELDVSPDKRTLTFDMNDYLSPGEIIEGVVIKNENTHKVLEASNLRFFDRTSLSGVEYTREISGAHDAKLELNGITIVRDTNTIDDLIKGVTLFVLDETRGEESLKIDRDYDTIISSITDFLGEYNQLLDLIQEKTRVSEDGKPGVFSGEYSLTSLTSRLRTIMMNSYNTDFADELSLLAQIGISTNASNTHRMDKEKLRGILEVNEDEFVTQMEKYAEGVKQLFGNDTDGDYVIDSGIAYEVDKFLDAYTMKGQGYFDMKKETIAGKIEDQEKDIEDYKEKMDREEQKLKEEFYKMEKAAQELEDNKSKFNNMKNQ